MKRFLSLFICTIFGALHVFAYQFSAESPSGHTLFYDIIDYDQKYVRLVPELSGNDKYENPPAGELIIPGTVVFEDETYTVTEILYCAFSDCNKITSLIIQEGVQKIGNSAFSGCSKLQSVALPNSLTDMEDCAFTHCKKLTDITFSNNLTIIPSEAFRECDALQSIVIPGSVKTIDSYAFYICPNLTSVTLCEGVTKIKQEAFGHCYTLSSITIPESVTYIGKSAFTSTALASISIPASVTELADETFYYCYNLTQIYFNSATPPSIGSNIFAVDLQPKVYVPCDAVDAYKSDEDWIQYKSLITSAAHKVFVKSSNNDYGYVTIEETNACSDEHTVTITAYSMDNDNYQFNRWDDGNKENPRTITVTEYLSFTAILCKKPKILNLETTNPICTSAT
ncbi:MAG: leucine-rich repeat domain-containing protein, partial [Bacteroidales bacterium]|nr:leucine-rich repeat domain-containing protein [Bacteroidales bacterium]